MTVKVTCNDCGAECVKNPDNITPRRPNRYACKCCNHKHETCPHLGVKIPAPKKPLVYRDWIYEWDATKKEWIELR